MRTSRTPEEPQLSRIPSLHCSLEPCTVQWNFDALAFKSLPGGAFGCGFFICLAITFNGPCQGLGLNYARLLLSAQMVIPGAGV